MQILYIMHRFPSKLKVEYVFAFSTIVNVQMFLGLQTNNKAPDSSITQDFINFIFINYFIIYFTTLQTR